ncbi:MAG: hypothetical protein ACE5I5_00045 [Candidatus Heimdallarchaeota archaeon]
MKKESFAKIILLTTLLVITYSITIPATRASPPITVFFDNLVGFNAAAGSPPIVVDFDDITPNTDITDLTIQGMTFNLGIQSAPSAPLIVVRGEDTYTPSEGFEGDWPPIRPDNKLFATTGENILSPGGVKLAPGPNSELENDDLALTLSTPVSAIGFDLLYQALDGCSLTAITLLDATGTTLYYNEEIPIPGDDYTDEGVPGGTTFVGFVSDSSNIAKIIIDEFDSDEVNPDSNIGLDTIRLFPILTTTPPGESFFIPGWEWLPALGALGLWILLLSPRKPRRQ